MMSVSFPDMLAYHRHWSAVQPLLSSDPRFLNIILDICNICNLRCRFCYLAREPSKEARCFVPAETLRMRLQAVLPYVKLLRLSCGYEPLASPYFIDVLKMLVEYRIPQLELVTNATLLMEENIEAIIKYGVTNLMFSMDSPVKATYENIRRGAQFEPVVNNIKRVGSLKKELGSKTPYLTLIAVLMKMNLGQIEELIDLAVELGVTHMDLRHLVIFEGLNMENEALTPEVQQMTDPALNRIRDKALSRGIRLTAPHNFGLAPSFSLARYIRSKYLITKLNLTKAFYAPARALHAGQYSLIDAFRHLLFNRRLRRQSVYCAMPFDHIVMEPSGRVKACPYLEEALSFDPDYEVSSLADVFLGNYYRDLRQRMLNAAPPDACHNCPHCRLFNLFKN